MGNRTKALLKAPLLYHVFGRNRIIDQGDAYANYIRKRNRWLCAVLVSTIIPYLLPFFTVLMTTGYEPSFLFSNGEMLLSEMALLSPFIFDLTPLIVKGKCLFIYIADLVIWIIQIIIYSLIRYSNIICAVNTEAVDGTLSNGKIWILSTSMFIFTLVLCYGSLCLLYYRPTGTPTAQS